MSELPQNLIRSKSSLRKIIEPPIPISLQKSKPFLDEHCRRFIGLSPFLILSTISKDGTASVSPRGDPPGFVQVLNDRTLLIPDRPGNNRVDSMSNILEVPSVGLIFLIPGIDETLRVNGSASIIRDSTILSKCSIRGQVPKLALCVTIHEAFLHCGKALKRAHLWDASRQLDRRELPSLARMILEQTAGPDQKATESQVKEAEKMVEEDYRDGLY